MNSGNWRSIYHHLAPILGTLVLCFSSFAVVRTYYYLKPVIPRRIRFALRRRWALRQRKRADHRWPICEEAGQQPPGWDGWPGGKRFALVLTHDIESPLGIDRVKEVAELEMAMGFRSSFNFIPEGPYVARTELMSWLKARGFEVGVHDHRHDGKLYRSWNSFQVSAGRINGYLKEWNAVGFRSGFMMRNLEWIQNLDVLYDASTFDTDPFEPQPDGSNTIFPFWVGGSEGKGYVELPYTLAQDSTLFLIFKEKTNEIWKRKLAWIAGRGGMALVNVHPDYMAFGKKPNRYEYSVDLYRSFLQHVKNEYAGQYWHVLPRDMARFVRPIVQPRTKNGAENFSAVPRLEVVSEARPS
jgi:hypothetical protein